ncbi:hypothetical protein [Streptomyces hygroscopicus]|uniref:hypothetical protein n=1 Tax=Streptomyces hygroscopicus TaxID=1912 RepID=UPI002240B342|nr:hypothetical protein [Streptomyces hygroscopicus]
MQNIQRKAGVFGREGEANSYTAESRAKFPEIRSFLGQADKNSSYDTNSDPRIAVTISINTDTAQLVVFADPAELDDIRDRRIAQIIHAVSRVHDAGFTLPSPLQFYLPKYTRRIHLPSLKVDGAWNSLAEFYAPNRIMLSPELLSTSPPTSAPNSVALKLGNASAAIVHEMGHCLHFMQAPESFGDLFHTKLAPQYERTANNVSEYGSRNPHEFVAEMFTNATFNGASTQDQWNLYRALGGPLPARPASTPTTGRALPEKFNRSVIADQDALAAAAMMQPFAGNPQYVVTPSSSSRSQRNSVVERTNLPGR